MGSPTSSDELADHVVCISVYKLKCKPLRDTLTMIMLLSMAQTRMCHRKQHHHCQGISQSLIRDDTYVSSLIKPKQVFVNGVVAYDPAKNVGFGLLFDMTLPIVKVFSLTRGPYPTTAISTIITAFDNDVVQNIYILVSSTQTTTPTSMEIKSAGTQIPGNPSSYNATGLSANTYNVLRVVHVG